MRKKIFRRTFFLSFMILALCLAGFSKEKTIESVWSETSLKIDGLADDWVEDTLNFEKKVEVDYAFRNDEDNLYVLFVFKNPLYLSTINATGMTLWLNTEGKKKKRYGINFRVRQVTADQLISDIEEKQGPLPESQKNEIKSRPHYLIYKSDVRDKKDQILTDTALGGELTAPMFRLQGQQKIVFYEFRIPLRILENLSADQRMNPGDVVKVGFEWGGLTEEMKAARIKRLAASSERSAEQTPDTGGGGGGSQSMTSVPGASTRKGPVRYSFWVDVKLAKI